MAMPIRVRWPSGEVMELPKRELIIFDEGQPLEHQTIHVDKRHYEVYFSDETESSVEIIITRKELKP